MNSRAPLPQVRLRAAVLVAAALTVLALCTALGVRTVGGIAAAAPRPTAGTVVEIASLVLATGTAWLAVLVLLAAIPLLRGTAPSAPSAPRTPRRVRAAVLLLCGIGIALPTPGLAAERPGSAYGDRVTTAVLLDGLRLPDRLAGPVRAPAAESAVRAHRVRAGDTLWALARTTLPPGADDAAVDRRWRALHAANRAAVGPDPHLLRIGTHLTLPAPSLGKARP